MPSPAPVIHVHTGRVGDLADATAAHFGATVGRVRVVSGAAGKTALEPWPSTREWAE